MGGGGGGWGGGGGGRRGGWEGEGEEEGEEEGVGGWEEEGEDPEFSLIGCSKIGTAGVHFFEPQPWGEGCPVIEGNVRILHLTLLGVLKMQQLGQTAGFLWLKIGTAGGNCRFWSFPDTKVPFWVVF